MSIKPRVFLKGVKIPKLSHPEKEEFIGKKRILRLFYQGSDGVARNVDFAFNEICELEENDFGIDFRKLVLAEVYRVRTPSQALSMTVYPEYSRFERRLWEYQGRFFEANEVQKLALTTARAPGRNVETEAKLTQLSITDLPELADGKIVFSKSYTVPVSGDERNRNFRLTRIVSNVVDGNNSCAGKSLPGYRDLGALVEIAKKDGANLIAQGKSKFYFFNVVGDEAAKIANYSVLCFERRLSK